MLAMGLLCLVYVILALRTNIVFVLIFATLTVAFACLAGAYWQLANGNMSSGHDLTVTAGAFCFVTCACGWWIFFAIMLAALDFPFQLPGKRPMAILKLDCTDVSCSWGPFDYDQGCQREEETG